MHGARAADAAIPGERAPDAAMCGGEAMRSGHRRPAGASLHAELRGWPGFAVCEVARIIRHETDAALADTGLRWDDVALLKVVDAIGELSLSALADRTGIDRTTLATLVDDLEDEGVVARSRGAFDGRKVAVRSAKGTEWALTEAAAAISAGERRALRRLRVSERQRLHVLAQRALPEPEHPLAGLFW